jgi:hypothetical protein
LKTFVIFPLRFVLNARRIARTSDVVLVVTSPFFMPVLAAACIGRGRPALIALMNDIYPEGLVAKGIISRNGLVERSLQRMFDAAFHKICALVFISEHHRQFVTTSSVTRTVVIPVSAHSDPFVGHEPTLVTGPIQVTYCGTLGMMHETGTFLGWLERHGERCPMRFLFHTSGASKRKFESDVKALQAKAGLRTEVALRNALPEAPWVQVMKSSQVGLVFQDGGAAKIIFPSKLAGILAAGQAVLMVAEQDSDVARLVIEHGCGWVVNPGDVAGFEASMRDMLDAQLLLAKRRNAFLLGHSMFSKEAVARSWMQLFDMVVSTPLH